MPKFRLIAPAACMLLATGCSTSSHVITGTPRPPISPDSVRIYTTPPAKFEQIATIDASSQGSFAFTSQANMDKAMERLRIEAAKLGANGVLLQGVHDTQTGSVGTGVGSSSYGPSSASGVGVGGSFALTSKAAQGLAIYVPPEAQNAAAPFPLMSPPPPPPQGTAAPATPPPASVPLPPPTK